MNLPVVEATGRRQALINGAVEANSLYYLECQGGYWQRLHDKILITISGSRYEYITIHCDTIHTAIYCDIPHSPLKM